MNIMANGILSAAEAGTNRASLTFPAILALTGGELVATGRAGPDKDSGAEYIELYRSDDLGKSWSKPETPFHEARVEGHRGSLKLCYLTEIEPGYILAAAMWVDRDAHPGAGLFNAETEGCLPMAILLADSFDEGHSFSEWRKIDLPEDLGPPSLTNPLLKLADASLLMSIETNKQYDDASAWTQRAVQLKSFDGGQTWSAPCTIAQDPSGRLFNWDLRLGIARDGTLASFAWTYDTKTKKYLNIHRRISRDHGLSWSEPENLGFSDQAGPPAMLADGRMVLPYVDRFDTQTIRVRLAESIEAPFTANAELVIYRHGDDEGEAVSDTGDLLAGMELWGFGLPCATALPDGEVLVSFYAGTATRMDLHWVRIAL